MASPLTLKLILAGAAKAAAELKPLDKQSRAAAAGLKQSRDALKLLNGQLSQIDGIRKYQGELAKQGNGLKVLRTNLASVTRTYGANSDQARALQGQVAKATAAYDKQRNTLMQLRSAATASGIRNLTADQTRLRSEVTSTNTAIAQQKARLEALANVSGKRAQLRETFGKTRAVAGNLAMAGAAGLGTAYGVKRAVTEPLHQVRENEVTRARIAALGLSKKETEDIVKYADGLKAYGVSKNEKMALALDASTAFADAHEATMVLPTLTDMKFANKAMFGEEQGAENERKFMDLLKVIEARGGLKNKSEFTAQADMVQRVITATGGRVDSTQWLDFIKRGGIAAKGMSSEAMYYQMEPIVQIMSGASAGVGLRGAYQNLYQGRTTKRAAQNLEAYGLIGDKSKVKHDKTGQTSSLNPGALLGSDLFRANQFEWMEKVLLPQLAKKGITDEKGIVDAIGSIFSNTSASGLFSMMFLMRDQIQKNAKLNAGADGIGQLKQRAHGTLGGRELEAGARFSDAMLSAGEALRPIYIRLLNAVTPVLESFSKFVRENPKLAESLGTVVAVVGLLAAGFGALSLGAAALLGPFAVIRYGLGLFGMKAGMALPILSRIGPALSAAAGPLVKFGALLLALPLGTVAVAIAAIAAGGLLIYKFWGPVKAFFGGVWDGFVAGLAPVMNGLSALRPVWDWFSGALGTVWEWLTKLMAPFQATQTQLQGATAAGNEFGTALANLINVATVMPRLFLGLGGNMVDGIISGITSRFAALRDVVVDLASSAAQWFNEALKIRSPSRVFMESGGYIVQGAAMGIDRALPVLRTAALGMAGATAVGMPAMAASFDGRPPLSASAAARPGNGIVVQGDTITIHVNATPGSDAQGIARAIRTELDKRDADKRARMRGAFIDYDN